MAWPEQGQEGWRRELPYCSLVWVPPAGAWRCHCAPWTPGRLAMRGPGPKTELRGAAVGWAGAQSTCFPPKVMVTPGVPPRKG